MPSDDRICKTAQQFSRYSLPEEDMAKLREIAEDECAVRNYVYQRYGSVKSIWKLYAGYTIQNEMTACGLREELGLPSVFYYSAMNDALSDIKTHWTQTASRIRENVGRNPNFNENDRHYIRFILKFVSCYANVFNGKEPVVDNSLREGLERLRSAVDCKRLDRYLRRQARRHMKKLHSDNTSGFSVTERGYRYDRHGIFLTTKEHRKRVFVELTDTARYKSRIYILLDTGKRHINIKVPLYVRIKGHDDYKNELGLSLGISHMLTTDAGRVYGADYGVYHDRLVAYVRHKGGANRRERANNPGKEKYDGGKNRLEEGLHNYVNRELNRMLREEKPYAVYMPKLPGNPLAGSVSAVNTYMTMWQRGYVRARLQQKCAENAIQFTEVMGKGIGSECSGCGAVSFTLRNGLYICGSCGLEINSRQNAARNALRRGRENTLVHTKITADK